MKNNLPQEFIHFVSEQLENDLELFKSALTSSAPVSIRVNKLKYNFQNSTPVSWCDDAYYLKERPSFVADPLFHAGCYYPQEASSMFLEHVIKQINLPENPLLLDLCAAPGGKSTLLLSYLNHKGLLVSNEVINLRAEILKENISKWGYANSIVTNNDPRDFDKLKIQFDAIVVDAPCSGEGMFRKDPNAINEWSIDNVNLCSSRQKRILGDIESSVKPGGYLIYSTCTYNEQEDEENVDWLVDNYNYTIIDIDILSFPEITKSNAGVKFYPHKTNGEGFFISVLQKPYNTPEKRLKKVKQRNFNTLKKELSSINSWIKINNELSILEQNQQIHLFPGFCCDELEHFFSKLQIISTGTLIGEITRKGINPTHELSQSIWINQNNFLKIELNLEEAIKFLRKDIITSSINQKGFLLVTYNNILLGWVKNLGNRLNNYYPKNWRIRKNI